MKLAAPLALLALAACCGDHPPQPPPPPAATSAALIAPPAITACRLPAPVKSEDACSSDADCGTSDPCHAHACVAKAKARPRTPDTMCTMVMDCQSADVNRCGCFEGRCALIPPP